MAECRWERADEEHSAGTAWPRQRHYQVSTYYADRCKHTCHIHKHKRHTCQSELRTLPFSLAGEIGARGQPIKDKRSWTSEPLTIRNTHRVGQTVYLPTDCMISNRSGAARSGLRWINMERTTTARAKVSSSYSSRTAPQSRHLHTHSHMRCRRTDSMS